MIRTEIIQRFRDENPEFTANVLSDTTLKSWLLVGDKEFCAKARLIVETGTITAIEDTDSYDLTNLTKFFDIDEYPGGGVSIIDTSDREKRLVKTTKSELDDQTPNWRTASSGTPKKYFRRGKYLKLDKPPDSTIESFNIDYIAISDDFNSDSIAPYNQLTHLEPFHYGLVLYLQWRAKAKVGKPEEANTAMALYNSYIVWVKKEVGGGKYGAVEFRPSGLPPQGIQRP